MTVYRTPAAALALGVSTRTLARLAKDIGKELRGNGKFNLYSQADIDRMKQIHEEPTKKPQHRGAFRT